MERLKALGIGQDVDMLRRFAAVFVETKQVT